VPYEFRKLYTDLVADDGTVCMLYLTWVRFSRRWYGRGGVEVYTPDGSRTLAHGIAEPPVVQAETPAEEIPLRVQLEDGRFELTFTPEHGVYTPTTLSPAPALHWHVKVARTRAVARWSGATERVVEGTGYIDWVHITKPTRLLGFHTLRWGRAHLGGRTVVFNALRLADGQEWRVGAEWSSEGRRDLGGFAMDLDEDGGGAIGLGDATLELSPRRVLHAGSAFDAERVPRLVDRMVVEALGGKTVETRWFAEAALQEPGRDPVVGTALHEWVRFGAAAR
jgi:hypothetical protein